ncbi:MAG: putative heme-binding domain-containing protein [Planctomycetota bacterium]|jgi:putative heme-binding domain-containing protein
MGTLEGMQISLSTLLPLVLVSLTACSQSSKFETLHDGETLDGWEGDVSIWEAREGMIVGSTVENPIEANTFLIWKGGQVENFHFRGRVRVEGVNNSGIQYRSQRKNAAGFALAGYQCDVHPSPQYLGMLYEEGTGRGILAERGQSLVIDDQGQSKLVGQFVDAAPFSVQEWNEYSIIAAGNRVLHMVNGVVTVDVIDQTGHAPSQGLLGLQVHAGPAMTVFAKDLELKALSLEDALRAMEEARASTALRPAADTVSSEQNPEESPAVDAKKGLSRAPIPTWIWGEDDNQAQFMRREFTISEALADAQLHATCDNVMQVWINGKEVAKSETWERPIHVDVTRFLRTDAANVIAVAAENRGGPAAMIAKLELRSEDGTMEFIHTGDAAWRIAQQEESRWKLPGFVDSAWSQPKKHGEFGVGPWGSPGDETVQQTAPRLNAPLAGDQLILAEGFQAELLYVVSSEEQGSWVCMTTDHQGRLIVSDQADKGLFRITPADSESETELKVQKIPVDISGAQGLEWAFDALYAHVSGVGLFRVTDSDGDDIFDSVEPLPSAKGGGEHGNHAVLTSFEGDDLFVAAGNHTDLPMQFVKGPSPASWQEDLLLPRHWDANGHARGRLAPGGWICRVTPDGSEYRVHSYGFRNQYDIALNRFGDLFTFDSDMEWDMGSPWYRPTRICLAISGADFGWRSGSGKWPAYYEDSLPALIDIGPGSPTGVVSGQGAKFPPSYQDAIFALDWTFGTIYSVHLTPQGAGYTATAKEFVSGAPLPVTDAVIGADGAFYFVTGGRGTQSALYRVKYVGEASTRDLTSAGPDLGPPDAAKARALRHSLEEFHQQPDPQAIRLAWPHLSSPDRFLRHAARIAVESQPVEEWQQRALAETDMQARITAAVAIARCADASLLPRQLDNLLSLPVAQLTEGQFLGMMRAYALTFMRLGEPSATQRQAIMDQLMPLLPAKSADRNTELIRVLVHLEAPGIIPKTVALLAAPQDSETPEWGALIARNKSYGGGIERMLANPGPTRALNYAFMLRNVRFGWTLAERRTYLQFLKDASAFPGGNSYLGFLENIRKDALAGVSQAELTALADIVGDPFKAVLGFEVTPAQGPGRSWTLDSLTELFNETASLEKRDFAAGRNLFHATACAACHRFDGAGGAIGPDLSTVRNKFQVRELLESIVEPSKVISDQYSSSTVTFQDGNTQTGIVIERDGVLEIYTKDITAIPTRSTRDQVRSIEHATVSQMPPGLLNSLSPDEVRNLTAFLLSGGNAEDPMFD